MKGKIVSGLALIALIFAFAYMNIEPVNSAQEEIITYKDPQVVGDILASGYDYSFIKGEDNKSVLATGNNKYGQLGVENSSLADYKTVNFSPAIAAKDEVTEIQTNGIITVALTKNGKVYANGYNQNITGEFVNKTCKSSLCELKMPSKVKQVSLSYRNLFVLTTEGKVYGTGKNNDHVISSESETKEIFDDQEIASGVSAITSTKVVASNSNKEEVTLFFKQGGIWYVRGANSNSRAAISSSYKATNPDIIKNAQVIKPDGKEIKAIYTNTNGTIIRTVEDELYAIGKVNPDFDNASGLGLNKAGYKKLTFKKDNKVNNEKVSTVVMSSNSTVVSLSDGTTWYSGVSFNGKQKYDSFENIDDLIKFDDVKKIILGFKNIAIQTKENKLVVASKNVNTFGSITNKKLVADDLLGTLHFNDGEYTINKVPSMKLYNGQGKEITNGKSKTIKTIEFKNAYKLDENIAIESGDDLFPYILLELKDDSGKVVYSQEQALALGGTNKFDLGDTKLSKDQTYSLNAQYVTKNIIETNPYYLQSEVKKQDLTLVSDANTQVIKEDKKTAKASTSGKIINSTDNVKVDNVWVEGRDHAFIQKAGSNGIMATGVNSNGRLGDKTSAQRSEWIAPSINPVLEDDEKVIDLKQSNDITMFVTSKGNVYATGKSTEKVKGAYADDVTTNSKSDMEFTKLGVPEKITQIALSSKNSFMLGESGTLYGTGRNSYFIIDSTEGTEGHDYDDQVIAKNVSDIKMVNSIELNDTNYKYMTLFFKQDGKWFARGSDISGRSGTSIRTSSGHQKLEGSQEVMSPDGKEISDIYPSSNAILIKTKDGQLYGQGKASIAFHGDGQGGNAAGLNSTDMKSLQKVKFLKNSASGEITDLTTDGGLKVKNVYTGPYSTLVELNDESYWVSGNNYTSDNISSGASFGTGLNDPNAFVQLNDTENTGPVNYAQSEDGKADNIEFKHGIQKYVGGTDTAAVIDNEGTLFVVDNIGQAFGSKQQDAMTSVERKQWHTVNGVTIINAPESAVTTDTNGASVDGYVGTNSSNYPVKTVVKTSDVVDTNLSNNTSHMYWPWVKFEIKKEDGKVIYSDKKVITSGVDTTFTYDKANFSANEKYTINTYFYTPLIDPALGTYLQSREITTKVITSAEPETIKTSIDYDGTEYTEKNSSIKIGSNQMFTYNANNIQIAKNSGAKQLLIDVPAGVSDSDISINVESKVKGTDSFVASKEYKVDYNEITKQYAVTLTGDQTQDYVFNIAIDFTTERDFSKGKSADLTGTFDGNELTAFELVANGEATKFAPDAKQQILVDGDLFDPATEMGFGQSFNYQVYNVVMPKSTEKQTVKATMLNLGNLAPDGTISVEYKNKNTAGEYVQAPTSDYKVEQTDESATVTIETNSTSAETTYRINVPYATSSSFYGNVTTSFLSTLEYSYEEGSLTQELSELVLKSVEKGPDYLVEAKKNMEVENAWVSASNNSFIQLKGSKEVYATGNNSNGELGTGDKVTKTSYVPVVFNPSLPDDEYVVDIDIASECTIALTNKGNIYYTGVNHKKQRANFASTLTDTSATKEQKFSMLQMPEKMTKVGLTYDTTFYLGESGKLYGSGSNSSLGISNGSIFTQYSNSIVAQGVTDFKVEGTFGAYSTFATVYYKSNGTWYARGGDQQGQTATSLVYTATPNQITQKPVIKPDGKKIKNIYPSVTGVLLETEDGLLYGQGNVTALGGHTAGLDKKAQVALQKVKFWRKNSEGKTVDVTNNDLTIKKVHSSWTGTMVELSDGSLWYTGNNETEGKTGGTQIGTGINDPYTFVELGNISNSGLEAYRNSADGKGENITFPNGVQKFQSGENNALYIDNSGLIRVVTKNTSAFGSTILSDKSSLELRQWNLLNGLIQINENKKMSLSSDKNADIEGDINGNANDLPTKVTIDNPYMIDRELSSSKTDAYWPYAHIDIQDENGKIVDSTDIAVEDKKAIEYSIPKNTFEFGKEYTVTTYFHTKNMDSNSSDYRKSNGLSKTFKVTKSKAYVHYYGENYYDEAVVEPAEYFTYEIDDLIFKDEDKIADDDKMIIKYTLPNDVKFLNGDSYSATKLYIRPLGSDQDFVEQGGNRSCDFGTNTCSIEVADWMGSELEAKIQVHAYTDYSLEPGSKAPITAQVTHESGIEKINTVNLVRAIDERDPLEPYPYFIYDETRYHPDLEVEAGKSFIYNIDNINVDNTTYGGGRNLIIPIPTYLELDTSMMELYRRPMGSWGTYERVWYPTPFVADDKVIVPIAENGTSYEYHLRLKFKASDSFPDETKTYLRPYIEYDDSSMTDKKIEESIVYTEGANLDVDPTVESTDAKVFTTREATGTKQYPIRMGTYPEEEIQYVSEDINVPEVNNLTGIEFLLKMTDKTNLATFANKILSDEVVVEKTSDNGSTYAQIDNKNIEITYPSAKEINVKINDDFKVGDKYRIKFKGSMLPDTLSADGFNLNGFVKYVQGTETSSFEMSSINVYGLKPFGVEVETVMGDENISISSTDPEIYSHDIKYQYRVTNCKSCGGWGANKSVEGGKIKVPLTALSDITGRNDNKFNDYENIELRLIVDGYSLPTTTVKRWYPAEVNGTVDEINNQVNPVAQLTTYDLGVNHFGTVEHSYGIETYTRNALAAQTIQDGKIRVANALTVSTSVPESREVPSSWEGIDKNELVNVDLSDNYQAKSQFKLLVPPRFLDPTFEESVTTINGKDYEPVNFELSDYLTTNPKLQVSDQYVIEKYSGRVYNESYGTLNEETDNAFDIIEGQNDVKDTDLKISNTLSNQFLVNAEKADLHLTGKVYYQYENYGLNKINYQVSRTVTNEKEMFGYFKRDAKYYFETSKPSDEVHACFVENDCHEIEQQATLFEGKVKSGSLIKSQIESEHHKIKSYKGANEWIDEYIK